MYQKQSLLASLALGLFGSTAKAAEAPEYKPSTLQDVWAQVNEDPYDVLPQNEVTVGKFFHGLTDMLLENSRRTLLDENDIIPYFDKLVHPNGICLKGTWNITQESPYTGAFKKGTIAPFIGRASTALTNTRAGQNRAFGLAGKIFGSDRNANFFTIEDLGGTNHDHFLDADLTNDIIRISPTLTAFMKSLVALTAFKDFPQAERSNLQTALIRELYPISELGLEVGASAATPVWLKISSASGMPRIHEKDFRDELSAVHYPDGLVFDVSVASQGSRFGDKEWLKLGFIKIDESVASESCDHRLHFAHPKARKIW